VSIIKDAGRLICIHVYCILFTSVNQIEQLQTRLWVI